MKTFAKRMGWWFAALGLVAVGAAVGRANQPADSLNKSAPWKRPSVKQTREAALAWLEKQSVDPPARAKAEDLLPAEREDLSGPDLLMRLAKVYALADPRAQTLVDLCTKPRSDRTAPDLAWLKDDKTPPAESHNLRLLYGVWLAQGSLFDESGEQLAGLEPDDVVDPASLLFYQGVVYHQLLNKDAGLKVVQELLDEPDQSPRRYAAVARLMREDLKGLKEDSLDHIARRMDDIHRRLDFGRAGPKVRKIEDGVIESLDKLIKDLEEQQRRQQQQQANSGGNMQPSSPAQDSRIMGGKGPGEVVKKNIGHKDGWGNLPPKEREEAMQQIGREFPSHYRDVIEQYFRKLAGEGSGRE